MAPYRRAVRTLLVLFALYGVLVATHLGEFWPFSIYPMFSQGGNPWSRAIVREVGSEVDTLIWTGRTFDTLPGAPYPLLEHGVDPIDLANFVSKTERWTPARVGGLRQMFYDQLDDRRLLILRANGWIDEDDSVHVTFKPYVVLMPDTALLNPALPR